MGCPPGRPSTGARLWQGAGRHWTLGRGNWQKAERKHSVPIPQPRGWALCMGQSALASPRPRRASTTRAFHGVACVLLFHWGAAAPFECHDKSLCTGPQCSSRDALLRAGNLCHHFPYYNGYAPLRPVPWEPMVQLIADHSYCITADMLRLLGLGAACSRWLAGA